MFLPYINFVVILGGNMDTIEKFNEQINNFKIGGKKAVKADLPVGDEL